MKEKNKERKKLFELVPCDFHRMGTAQNIVMSALAIFLVANFQRPKKTARLLSPLFVLILLYT